MILGLKADLIALREGRISVAHARAAAEVARQYMRGVHYIIQASRFLEVGARSIGPPHGEASIQPPRKGRRRP